MKRNVALLLSPCPFPPIEASEPDKAEVILGHIIQEKAAASKLQISYPNIYKLYDKCLEPRLYAIAKESHNFHLHAICFLYEAIAPEFIAADLTPIAGHFIIRALPLD
ncbi:MAG: hypothetical protein ABIV39_01995 [Verrucomicrobiota bacterium]